MPWNYRVVLSINPCADETVHEICEVYYEEDGSMSWCQGGSVISESNDESPTGVDGLRETLKMMGAALDMPVLVSDEEGALSEVAHEAVEA